jgi:hypothetical protein
MVCGAWAAEQSSIRSARLQIQIRNGTAIRVRNLLTGESYTSPKAGTNLAGLYAVGGKTRMVSDSDQVTAESNPTSITQSARWGDGAASCSSSFRFDASGDLVVMQKGRSSDKGVYGISWGIADIPDTFSVLIPGDSGQRLGSDDTGGEHHFDYPYTWEAPFVVIQGKSGGVVIYAEDPAFRFKSLFVEHVGSTFQIRFESRNQAPFDGLTSVESVAWRMRA